MNIQLSAIVEACREAELVLEGVKREHGGRYRVKVSGVGEVMSEVAVVEVLRVPRIVKAESGAVRVSAGGDLRLKVEAEGSGVLKYQWLRNGGAIYGAVGKEYVVRGKALAGKEWENQGMYEVVVSNGYGSVKSGVWSVTVEGAKDP